MTVSVLFLFLTVLWVGLQCVIVVFPDHTNFLLLIAQQVLDRFYFLISVSFALFALLLYPFV